MNKILVFDIAITGHHSEYIGHLVDYLYQQNDTKTEYCFVVHPEFEFTFTEIYEKVSEIRTVKWVPIKRAELSVVESENSVWSSFMTMKILHHYAKKLQVDHVIALDFHSIKYGAIFFTPTYSMSSILFLQFHRLEVKSRKQKLEYYKRYYFTKWSSANRQLKRIFILNDVEAVEFLNKEFNTTVFKMLPDPIPKLEPLEKFSIYNHYEIEPERKIFLHIGALGNRKGTQEVIEAALHLSDITQKKVAILLAGKASNTAEEKLFLELIKVVKNKTSVQIIWDNQFVPNPMMKSLFDQCDTVLLPYKNAEFSSGILGHAAAAQKRVIATNAGLIRELVTRYQLGELLDQPNAVQLAQKITEILNKKVELTGQNKFVSEHRPEVFAKMVLNL